MNFIDLTNTKIISIKQIKLVKLPRTSLALNPVERFFQEVRKLLSNQVFENKI